MNLRTCPVCGGMVLEDDAISCFVRHRPAGMSKEPATHMDGACFGSNAPTRIARPEYTPVRDEKFDAHGRPPTPWFDIK